MPSCGERRLCCLQLTCGTVKQKKKASSGNEASASPRRFCRLAMRLGFVVLVVLPACNVAGDLSCLQ